MIERRALISGAAAGAAAAGLPRPVAAQDLPEVRWRLTSSFPPSLDTIYQGAVILSEAAAAMTDGRFRIDVFAPGELVPGLQALDAVSNGTVECAHTSSYYYVGKDPTFTLGTDLPFALNSRMRTAWLWTGGGNQLLQGFYDRYGVHAIPLGNTGTQMGGWFRQEIKTPADLRGLKFRIAGLAGEVLRRLGVVPQQIPGGDIYPALERGTIDAAEWVGPHDDERLGFYKVAPFYYYPGFWEGGPALHLFISKRSWEALPPPYQAILEAAAFRAHTLMQARYDAQNPAALKRLVAAGAQLRPFPAEVMDAAHATAMQLYAEIAAANPAFKQIYEPMMAFRADQYLWWQVAEQTFDGFSIRTRRRG